MEYKAGGGQLVSEGLSDYHFSINKIKLLNVIISDIVRPEVTLKGGFTG